MEEIKFISTIRSLALDSKRNILILVVLSLALLLCCSIVWTLTFIYTGTWIGLCVMFVSIVIILVCGALITIAIKEK